MTLLQRVASVLLVAATAPVFASSADAAATAPAAKAPAPPVARMDDALARDWLARWEKNITGDARNRYCDREMGEEIGWLVSPFLSGF